MKWFFFTQRSGFPAQVTLLTSIGFMLDTFREEIGMHAEIHGHWEIEGVYVIEINDALLAAEFDGFLDINPEYDTLRECPHVAALS